MENLQPDEKKITKVMRERINKRARDRSAYENKKAKKAIIRLVLNTPWR